MIDSHCRSQGASIARVANRGSLAPAVRVDHDLRGAIIQIDGWDVATAIRMVRLHATNSPSPQLWESRDYEVSVIHSGEPIPPKSLPRPLSGRFGRTELNETQNCASRTAPPAIEHGKWRHSTALGEFKPPFLNGLQLTVNRKVRGSNPCPGAKFEFKIGFSAPRDACLTTTALQPACRHVAPPR